MSVAEPGLEGFLFMSTLIEYLRKAGDSPKAFLDFLAHGLSWPIPEGLEWDDLPIDWSLQDLDLNPEKVGPIKVHQLNLVTGQEVGILVLEFDNRRLPLAAIRRIIEKFLVTPGGKSRSGNRPAWVEDRILVFCLSPQDSSVHALGVARENDRRVLRTLSWSKNSPTARLELIVQRGVPELIWGERGPALTSGLSRATGFGAYRGAIKSAATLASRMAEVARELRDEVAELLDVETEQGPMRSLLVDFRSRLLPDLDHKKFADMYAQTMVYGLLSARVTHPELFDGDRPLLGIDFSNVLLDTLYSRFRAQTSKELDVDELGLGALADELARTDVEELLADFGTKDRKMDPVVFLYEQFLQQYDPRQRIEAGAFYTPLPVVQFMTRAVDHILKTSFHLPLGIADSSTWSSVCSNLGIEVPDEVDPDQPFLSMIDPATGTGTYLMEWIRTARASYVSVRGEVGWSEHFEKHVARSMHAFELMLAPYAIAHLKFAMEGHTAGVDDVDPTILLSDTLQHPALQAIPTIWGEEVADPISVEAEKADTLKTRERFTVVIGNPPYYREQGAKKGERKGGGVVRNGVPGIPPLIGDLTGPMSNAGQGRHIKNLYNDYVYFWRWATWKATQDLGDGPGIVAMITASSYLSGKSMSGLRAHLRDVFDDFYVIDLGGEGRGANVEENVFDILTPVAIGIGVRRSGKRDRSQRTECSVHYVRVRGSRSEKLDWLDQEFDQVDFNEVTGRFLESMAPVAQGVYSDWPSIEELMPWSISGVQVKRTWPVGPSIEILRSRWDALLASRDKGTALRSTGARHPAATPGALLDPTKSLRSIEELREGDQPEAYGRYGYRSFDRQWLIQDKRVIDAPRAELWEAHGDKQLYLNTLTSTSIGMGPVLTATPYVPDLHNFRGSFGARSVFPVWRDRDGMDANLGPLVLEGLQKGLEIDIGPGDVLNYLYGIGGTGAFSERFREELAIAAGPVRLPITRKLELFNQVAELGEELLRWHTWGERHANGLLERGPAREVIPITGQPSDFGYDSQSRTLRVGSGTIEPVSPEVWDFDVSGMKPLRKWLGYRMAKRQGRTSSPLDAITYDEWSFTDELLFVISILQKTIDLTPHAADLLDKVVAGPLFTAEELT